ncbi:MAG: ribonuclease E activity regulator RraA [Gammaproteobacteria bacterium]|nr:ribonuclease E activity regulator RraA [Gammaproteobacteria bacterium]
MQKLSLLAENPEQTLTADLCDEYEDARVVTGPFINYGNRRACIGPVEVIATQDDNSLVSATLKESGDDRILIVDNAGSTICAMVGGDLARAAHRNGWQGIIVNGAIRDVVELQDVPISIFALAACPRKSAKRGLGVRGEPIDFAGITVNRGDIAAADADGVIIIDASVFKEA